MGGNESSAPAELERMLEKTREANRQLVLSSLRSLELAGRGQRSADLMARLRSVSTALSETLQLPQIAQLIVGQAVEAVGADGGIMALPAADGASLEAVIFVGQSPRAEQRWRRIPMQEAQPLPAALQRLEPVMVESQEEQQQRYPKLAGTGIVSRAVAAIPMIAGTRAIGGMLLTFGEPRHLADEEIDFLRILAQQGASALEQIRLREDFHRLQQQRDALVHSVSHDLRNPLTAILGQGQLLERALAQKAPGDRTTRSAEAIVASARRLNLMIQELVDATRLEAGQLRMARQPVELGTLVAGLLGRSEETLAVDRVDTGIAPGLPPVDADPNRLEQILVSLLSNALSFSPPETKVLLKAAKSRGAVAISVIDKGPGIAPEELPELFERYPRVPVARRGEGLKLYIARMLVEAHGGRMWAESEPGKGTSIHLTLPVARKGR